MLIWKLVKRKANEQEWMECVQPNVCNWKFVRNFEMYCWMRENRKFGMCLCSALLQASLNISFHIRQIWRIYIEWKCGKSRNSKEFYLFHSPSFLLHILYFKCWKFNFDWIIERFDTYASFKQQIKYFI